MKISLWSFSVARAPCPKVVLDPGFAGRMRWMRIEVKLSSKLSRDMQFRTCGTLLFGFCWYLIFEGILVVCIILYGIQNCCGHKKTVVRKCVEDKFFVVLTHKVYCHLLSFVCSQHFSSFMS